MNCKMENGGTTRVALFSNNPLMSEGLRSVFGRSPDFELAAWSNDLGEFAASLAGRRPDSPGGFSHRVNPACATRLAPPRGRCPNCSVGRSVHRVWIPRHGDGRSRDHTGGDTDRVPYRGT